MAINVLTKTKPTNKVIVYQESQIFYLKLNPSTQTNKDNDTKDNLIPT